MNSTRDAAAVARPCAAAAVIHPSVQQQVAEWLEDAAHDARNADLYPNPHLAEAFASLAASVRRLAPASPHRAESPESRTS
jgi:hypothetical protein